jgi:hypothetical protein
MCEKMYDKIFEHIKKNEPLYIKDFFSNSKYKKAIDNIINLSKSSNEKNDFLKGSCYIKLESNIFINDVLKKLNKNKDIEVYKQYRIWNHKKNNITPWHYDGNGIDVLNICFSGKKEYILSKPNSQITIPFTNITILETNQNEYKYILEPGDLLLIPRFWFHKVISLKDDTITLNFCLTNKYNTIPKNFKMLYNLHNFLKTQMSLNENICKYSNISISMRDFILYFMKENILLFVLFLTIKLVIQKLFKITFELKNNFDKLLLFTIFTEYKYQKNSVGMSRLLIVGSILNNLIIDKLIK